MNTEYKGFTIEQAEDGRFYTIGQCGNSNGYATLNNAKGAITKHLNARNAKHDAGMEVLAARWQEQDKQKAKACASNGTNVLSVPVAQQKPIKATQSRNKREGRYAGKLAACKHVRGQCHPSVKAPSIYAALKLTP